MNALDIIAKKISVEGLPLSLSELRDRAIRDVEEGRDRVFQYDDVVFTLGMKDALIHAYSDDSDKFAFYRASRQFTKDAWEVGHNRVYAPILNSRMRLFAARMGMKYMGLHPSSYRIYYADRSFYG